MMQVDELEHSGGLRPAVPSAKPEAETEELPWIQVLNPKKARRHYSMNIFAYLSP